MSLLPLLQQPCYGPLSDILSFVEDWDLTNHCVLVCKAFCDSVSHVYVAGNRLPELKHYLRSSTARTKSLVPCHTLLKKIASSPMPTNRDCSRCLMTMFRVACYGGYGDIAERFLDRVHLFENPYVYCDSVRKLSQNLQIGCVRKIFARFLEVKKNFSTFFGPFLASLGALGEETAIWQFLENDAVLASGGRLDSMYQYARAGALVGGRIALFEKLIGRGTDWKSRLSDIFSAYDFMKNVDARVRMMARLEDELSDVPFPPWIKLDLDDDSRIVHPVCVDGDRVFGAALDLLEQDEFYPLLRTVQSCAFLHQSGPFQRHLVPVDLFRLILRRIRTCPAFIEGRLHRARVSLLKFCARIPNPQLHPDPLQSHVEAILDEWSMLFSDTSELRIRFFLRKAVLRPLHFGRTELSLWLLDRIFATPFQLFEQDRVPIAESLLVIAAHRDDLDLFRVLWEEREFGERFAACPRMVKKMLLCVRKGCLRVAKYLLLEQHILQHESMVRISFSDVEALAVVGFPDGLEVLQFLRSLNPVSMPLTDLRILKRAIRKKNPESLRFVLQQTKVDPTYNNHYLAREAAVWRAFRCFDVLMQPEDVFLRTPLSILRKAMKRFLQLYPIDPDADVVVCKLMKRMRLERQGEFERVLEKIRGHLDRTRPNLVVPGGCIRGCLEDGILVMAK